MRFFRNGLPKIILLFQVVIHPKYQFTPQADRYLNSHNQIILIRVSINDIRYDVALLRLDRPAYLQPHVLPICLPTPASTEGKYADHLGHYYSNNVRNPILF